MPERPAWRYFRSSSWIVERKTSPMNRNTLARLGKAIAITVVISWFLASCIRLNRPRSDLLGLMQVSVTSWHSVEKVDYGWPLTFRSITKTAC